MENELIILKLKEKFNKNILDIDNNSDILTVTVNSDVILEVIAYLKIDEELKFEFLTDLCGIHYPNSDLPFGVIYHLHNFKKNKRIRIKTFISKENPVIQSITSIFSGADWMERETYDFYGIVFKEHPNLKRILNVEYLDFFPMRKEYPLEDPTREDKDNRYFGR